MTDEKLNIKTIIFFALLLSGSISLIISIIFVVAEMLLRDPMSIFVESHGFFPTRASLKMFSYISLILVVFVYTPLKLGIHRQTISRRSGIVMVTVLTYFLSCVSLAFFLSVTTELINYDELSKINPYTFELRKKENNIPCTFDFRESFFDAVSGFTTTGLTAFRRTYVYDGYGKEISKIDAQPGSIHIIRASYLWIGGLGIMFFYLYFTPVPSLMMSMNYEMPTERSLPRFIRLESLSFSLVYVIVTVVGVLFLFLAISNASEFREVDNEAKWTYSVILSFSSISTGGFSPGSNPIDELELEGQSTVHCPPEIEEYMFIKYCTIEKLFNKDCIIRGNECYVPVKYRIIDNWGLLIIMGLMLAGAMPIFSLHRPLRYFRGWKIFALFFLPIFVYVAIFYSADVPIDSIHRSFDAISAFTTTGLYTSQFVEDFEMPLKTDDKLEYKRTEYLSEYKRTEYNMNEYKRTEYVSEYKKTENTPGNEKEKVKKIYEYRLRSIYMLLLMFIGGAAYSTAGGWGFFNFICIVYAFYLVLSGKIERVLTKFILRLILSFIFFFLIFAIGTFFCYKSELFGTLSGPDPAAIEDYVINAAFYEISALSTVGLMPDSMLQDGGIYYYNWAYWTLAASMLIGRLYHIIFPFFVLAITIEEET